MVLLDNVSQLPRKIVFRVVIGKLPCEDADYCYFHKGLKYYSCYYKVKSNPHSSTG